MKVLASLAAVLAVMTPCIALAQDAGSQDQPGEIIQPAEPVGEISDLPEVSVVARPNIREVIRSFITDVTTEDEPGGQIGRFDERVCPGVMNIQPGPAQIINDQIARAAFRVGLPVGRPGCRPNVLVIFVRDSDRFAPALVAEHPRVFRHHVVETRNGRQLMEEFSRPGRVVRWWHLTVLESEGYGASRIRSDVETDIIYSLLLVDLDRLGNVNLGTLGDYIAMTALARLSPDAQVGSTDTILNLFSDMEQGVVPTPSLTEWDVAYLQALYGAHLNVRGRNLAEGDMASRMRRALERAQD